MSAPATILVGLTNKIVWIKVEGKGSFQNSSGMKDFAKEMVNRGYREFVVDLKKCPVMDSTFMGTLAGIALRLREMGQGNLHVINLNERNNDLLCNLGLDQLFRMDMEGLEEMTVPNEETLQPEQDRKADTHTMLEAHEALVAAAPANLTKFKDVLEYLKQDLNQSS